MLNRLTLKRIMVTFLQVLPFIGLILLVNPSLILASDKSFGIQNSTLYILIVSSFAISMLLALIISLMSDKYYRIVLSLFKSLFIVSFVITIFFPVGSEMQDGQVRDAVLSRSQYLLNYGSYFIALCFSMYIFMSNNILKRVFTNLFILMALFSAVIFGSNVYEYYRNQANSAPNAEALAAAEVGMYNDSTDFSFGSEKNIVVIMADMLQGSTLEQFLSNNPAEKNGFEGFTLYSRAISPFPYTSYGVPAILTGDTYINGEKANQPEVLKHTQESSLLQDAVPYKYDKTVVSLTSMTVDKDQFSFNNVIKEDPHSLQTSIYLVDLGLKRIFKQKIISLFFTEHAIDPIMGLKINSREMMNRLAHSTIGKSPNRLIYIHNMVPHAPTGFICKNERATENDIRAVADTVENYWLETSFFLGQVRDVLEQMKKIGVYNNSLIIITGDHGHFICNKPELYKYNVGTEDFYGADQGPWRRAVGMYNAAILIKPPLDSEPLKISRASASTTGIRSVVQTYLRENDATKVNFQDVFQKNSKIKIIVFDKDIKSNPYFTADDHVEHKFEGNVADLRTVFVQERNKKFNDYVIGAKPTNPQDYLIDHWSKEKEGSWLMGHPGTMGFKLNDIDSSKEHILRLDFRALTSEKHPNQRVVISVNGKVLGEYVFTGFDNQSVDIVIPATYLLSNNANIIEFKPLDAISPRKAGLWKTDVPISLLISSFQILDK